MKLEKKVFCPNCDSKYTDLVSYVYRCLESEDAGRKFFSDEIETEVAKKKKINPDRREELKKKLCPPMEAKISFPALTVALMAFLISWLVVGSVLASRIGEKTYFFLTLIIVGSLAYPFFSTMEYIIAQVRKNYAKYKKEKSIWVKKYFCYDCEHVFSLKKEPEEK
ncbi:MAG: hypothetical protein PHY73_01575 [Candidatus Omnitrophica bacterium]|nr:hypothetical protein [Candidatus Omnitrophota bacterium]